MPAPSGNSDNVKVVVRCRPMSKKEVEDKRVRIVNMDTTMGRVEVVKPGAPNEEPKVFTFDAIFDWNSTQRNVYDETAAPIVSAVLEGYNGTIFAYGQTGTGKTFTMEGVQESKELRGIIPNSFEHIFDHIALSTGKEYLVRASYLEIYNENIRDLLSDNQQNNLELKEHPEKGVYVKDLSALVVKSVAEIDHVMKIGAKNRSVGFTLMNQNSSRSHSIFTITIESSEPGVDGKPHFRVGKLNLVDLAGSERQTKTGATGMRLVEATKINLSLSALGNVIGALVEGNAKHIPYRDSKLTRLLQDSLGGNAKTVMVANMGPADYNYDETMSTLRYASRAKNIKNKPKINEDPKDAMLRELQEQIEKLKQQLAAGPTGGGGGGATAGTVIVKKIAGNAGLDPAYLEKIKNQKEEEIRAALAEKGLIQEEVDKIANELHAAREQIKAEEEEKLALQKKLALVQEKLLSGNLQDENAKQEAEIRRQAAELERRAIEEKRLQRELKEKEESRSQKEEAYKTLKDEAEGKTKKIKKLWQKLQGAKEEAEDLMKEFQQEREDLYTSIRELTMQLRLKTLIIDNFIPPDEVKRVESKAEWNEETETWVLTHKKYLGNNSKLAKRPPSATGAKRPTTEYAKMASNVGDSARFKGENILELDLEMPDRTTFDYEGPSVEPRMQAALNAALAEEEDTITFVAQDSLPSLAASPSISRTPENGTKKKRPSSRPGSSRRRAKDAVSVPQEEFPVAKGLRSRK